jgi:hypothetical protein
MRKVGKIGRRNIKANKILKAKFEELGITCCEVCGTTWALSFAHKHRRHWYRSQPELLSDISHCLLLCVPCHQKIEGDQEATDALFARLRGSEQNA